ncbi:hypothetical protein MEQU1_001590 [Malassezia equina]|uniref:DUF4604 domain-containing protein n=1 Tax=Malassezia equina TaxID=1381935 RepID=A0AAF0IYI3_9BASI|nr:hypothetical protein MEQU1_001590 [Malassezia equina]
MSQAIPLVSGDILLLEASDRGTVEVKLQMGHIAACPRLLMSRYRDEEGPPLSAREKKSLTYTQETPSFLRQLHAQVRGTHFEDTSERERKQGADVEDPLLDWMAPGAKRTGDRADRERDEYDSDDDLAHAQVVVLKEGKHLTKEDYDRMKSQDASTSPSSDPSQQPTQPVAEAGAAAQLRKSTSRIAEPKQAKVMQDAKKWIHSKRSELRDAAPKHSKKTKKRPPGTGLSFSMEEE